MPVLNNTELRQMIELAQTNAAFGELFESMLTMYYLLKEKS
jgi:hypothetical protein